MRDEYDGWVSRMQPACKPRLKFEQTLVICMSSKDVLDMGFPYLSLSLLLSVSVGGK